MGLSFPAISCPTPQLAAPERASASDEYSPGDLKDFAAPKTASDLRDLLAESIIEIRAGKLDPRVANALGYLGASYLRALEVSEVEAHLDVLEANQRTEERAYLRSSPAGSKQEGRELDGQGIHSGPIGEVGG